MDGLTFRLLCVALSKKLSSLQDFTQSLFAKQTQDALAAVCASTSSSLLCFCG
jgi:hypothetical protein